MTAEAAPPFPAADQFDGGLTTLAAYVRLGVMTDHPDDLAAMTKSELIARLADKNPHLYQRDVERIVTTIFDEISAALARGDRVELRGFGAFAVKYRNGRKGRNPRTGAEVTVPSKALPSFKTGRWLRDLLNGRNGERA